MSRKSLILALAAVATLGTVALASSEASARSVAGGGGGGVHASGGMHAAPRLSMNRPLVTGIRVKPPIVTGISIKPGKVTGIVINKPHHHWHWPRWYWWRYYGRSYWIAPTIATGGVATYAATTTTNRCTCLTKEYTPQGAVVFKDVCTTAMAMNPPANVSPAAYMPQPQQQGYLQPQSQPQVQ